MKLRLFFWFVLIVITSGLLGVHPPALGQQEGAVQRGQKRTTLLERLQKGMQTGNMPGAPPVESNQNEEQNKRVVTPYDLQDFMKSLINNPFVAKINILMLNYEFLEKMTRLLNHPRWGHLIYVELGALIFLIIFQEWVLFLAKYWWHRLLYKFLMLPFYFGVLIVLAPWTLLGDDYWGVLKIIYQTFRS